MKHNTPRQNKNCLQNFDLSDYRQVFSDLAIQIHHQFINVMEDSLFPMIGMLLVFIFHWPETNIIIFGNIS